MSRTSYVEELERSSHPVTVMPMSVLDVQHVFLRFQLGRHTFEDRRNFRYSASMDIGAFVEANHIDIREISAQAAELSRVIP